MHDQGVQEFILALKARIESTYRITGGLGEFRYRDRAEYPVSKQTERRLDQYVIGFLAPFLLDFEPWRPRGIGPGGPRAGVFADSTRSGRYNPALPTMDTALKNDVLGKNRADQLKG